MASRSLASSRAKPLSPVQLAREKFDSDVSRLFARGYSKQQIGQILAVHPSRISVAINRIRENYKRLNSASFERHVLDQLRALDALKQEAWEAWERSLKPRETTHAHVNTQEKELLPNVAAPGPVLVSRTSRRHSSTKKEETTGDPRYLEIILQCEDRRAKLLGLEQPSKLLIVHQDATPHRTRVEAGDDRTAAVLKILQEVGALSALAPSNEPVTIDVEPS